MATKFIVGAGPTYTNGDTSVSSSGTWYIVPVDPILPSSGKWYVEFNGHTGDMMFGIAQTEVVTSDQYPGQGSVPAMSAGDGWRAYTGGVFTAVQTSSNVSGNTRVGLAVDMDAGKCEWHWNGVKSGEVSFSANRSDLSLVVGPFSGHGTTTIIQAGSELYKPSGYTYLEIVSYTISGVVRDDADAPCQRSVAAYLRSSKALVATGLSDASTGEFTLGVPTNGEHFIVFLDDDAGTDHNAIILDRVTPI